MAKIRSESTLHENQPRVQGRRDHGVALLIRHRWIADPLRGIFICTPGVSSLYKSFDLICFGCGLELQWCDVPDLGRFEGVSRSRVLGEALGVRLDLRVCEIAIERARKIA